MTTFASGGFDANFADTFDVSGVPGAYDGLIPTVAARAGRTPSSAWMDVCVPEIMAGIRTIAPNRRGEWVDPGDLPEDVKSVFTAAIARRLVNPNGFRTEMVGEYSYTRDASQEFTDLEVRTIRQAAGYTDEAPGAAYSLTMESGCLDYSRRL